MYPVFVIFGLFDMFLDFSDRPLVKIIDFSKKWATLTTHCFYRKDDADKEFKDFKKVTSLLEKAARVTLQIQDLDVKVENLLDTLEKSLYFKGYWKNEMGDGNLEEAYKEKIRSYYENLSDFINKIRMKIEDIKKDGQLDGNYTMNESACNMLQHCNLTLERIGAD